MCGAVPPHPPRACTEPTRHQTINWPFLRNPTLHHSNNSRPLWTWRLIAVVRHCIVRKPARSTLQAHSVSLQSIPSTWMFATEYSACATHTPSCQTAPMRFGFLIKPFSVVCLTHDARCTNIKSYSPEVCPSKFWKPSGLYRTCHMPSPPLTPIFN